MIQFAPAYLDTHKGGALQSKIDSAVDQLKQCRICPRDCAVDRTSERDGVCRSGRLAKVASFGPHYGEESPLVGHGGSGTIFLSSCNLLCAFCQNDDISHGMAGNEIPPEALAEMMLSLQRRGCGNINFVSPSHFVPQILEALPVAIEGGLNVPLVYNTGGYDTVETIRLLDGVFDIYMPDVKFMDPEVAALLCDAEDYPAVVKEAVREMHRQVGDLVIEQGYAVRGLLVRHLVMPGGLAGSEESMKFLASLSTDTYVNIMGQYRPWYRASEHPAINRRPSRHEMVDAYKAAKKHGLHRFDK